MKKFRTITKQLIITLLIALLIAFSLAGCGASQKPLPPASQERDVAPGPDNTNITPNKYRDLAVVLADEARKVQGVQSATVIVIGNVALAGLGLETGTSDHKVQGINLAVADRMDRNPSIVRAYVSSNPDVVQQLNDIDKAIKEGRPVTEYFTELNDIIARLAPQS